MQNFKRRIRKISERAVPPSPHPDYFQELWTYNCAWSAAVLCPHWAANGHATALPHTNIIENMWKVVRLHVQVNTAKEHENFHMLQTWSVVFL